MAEPPLDPATLPEPLRARVAGVCAVPLHRFLGFTPLAVAPGQARARFAVGPDQAANLPWLHGGALQALMDVTAYLAVLAWLDEGQTASTVDFTASMLRAAPLGATVEIAATAERPGRSLIFATVTAQAGQGTLARAQITKRVFALPTA